MSMMLGVSAQLYLTQTVLVQLTHSDIVDIITILRQGYTILVQGITIQRFVGGLMLIRQMYYQPHPRNLQIKIYTLIVITILLLAKIVEAIFGMLLLD